MGGWVGGWVSFETSETYASCIGARGLLIIKYSLYLTITGQIPETFTLEFQEFHKAAMLLLSTNILTCH